MNRMDCWSKLVAPITWEMESTFAKAESSLEFVDSQMEWVKNRMGEYSELDANETSARLNLIYLPQRGDRDSTSVKP